MQHHHAAPRPSSPSHEASAMAPNGGLAGTPMRRLIHHSRSTSAASYLAATTTTASASRSSSGSVAIGMPEASDSGYFDPSPSQPMQPPSLLPPPSYEYSAKHKPSSLLHVAAAAGSAGASPSSSEKSSSGVFAGLPSPRTLRAFAEAGRGVQINVQNYFLGATANGSPSSSSASFSLLPPAFSSSRPGSPLRASWTSHATSSSLLGAVSAAATLAWARIFTFLASMALPLLCLGWYAASALTNNAKKQILLSFPYPVTLTLAQFASVAVLCQLGHARGWFTLRPLDGAVVRTMAPLAVFQLGGHMCASMAMARVPVAFVHTVKALSPLFTVVVSRVGWGVKYPARVYVALVPLMAGVVLACTFGKASMAFNPIGFTFAALSTVIFVMQSIVSKRILSASADAVAAAAARRSPSPNFADTLLPKSFSSALSGKDSLLPTSTTSHTNGTVKLDKVNIMYHSSLLAFLCTVPMWLSSDMRPLLFGTPSSPTSEVIVDRRLVLLFLLNGLSHFSQALMSVSILARVSTVTYSIVSLLKRIVVIVAAILWFGDSVSGTQAVGVTLTFVGLWMYQRAKRG
ncbi:hypothetical protein H9P43_003160 [Blastocladiella emersonii ATCC 22665]|nr:hypothetical protein H9P43_003160 [Blastocladiella emersonii ATCC 22665]